MPLMTELEPVSETTRKMTWPLRCQVAYSPVLKSSPRVRLSNTASEVASSTSMRSWRRPPGPESQSRAYSETLCGLPSVNLTSISSDWPTPLGEYQTAAVRSEPPG